MNDKFDDLKRDLQELADEYNICLFGLVADSFQDMEQCRYNQFRCEPYHSDIDNTSVTQPEQDAQENSSLKEEDRLLWLLYHEGFEDYLF